MDSAPRKRRKITTWAQQQHQQPCCTTAPTPCPASLSVRDHVPTLLDTCAQYCAEQLTLAIIEQRQATIPTPVLQRLLYWAFPKDERPLWLYGSALVNSDQCAVNVESPLQIETLNCLDRQQLQKLVQYLISEHHARVLPATQRLADEILTPTSEISGISGAPDPTAGPDGLLSHSWYLDQAKVRSLVRSYLAAQHGGGHQIRLLFTKVREMLKRNDTNGPLLLRSVTEQFLAYKNDCISAVVRPFPIVIGEKLQRMWDQIGSLWMSIVLNPYAEETAKNAQQELLLKWTLLPYCPRENDEFDGRNSSQDNYTVLSRAYNACQLTWNDPHLRMIIKEEQAEEQAEKQVQRDLYGRPIWTEHVPTACARMESLRLNGHPKKAIRLAVDIARAIKFRQATSSSEQNDDWTSHPLNPVNFLFDMLCEAGKSGEKLHAFNRNCHKDDLLETFESLAFESALISLIRRQSRCNDAGRRFSIISSNYGWRKRAKNQRQNLMVKIKTVYLSSRQHLMPVVERQALFLMQAICVNSTSNIISASMYCAAGFLFESLLTKDVLLAYGLGLTALKFTIPNNEVNGYNDQTDIPLSTTGDHQEREEQSELAKTMLLSSRGCRKLLTTVQNMCICLADVVRLKLVLETIHEHVKSPFFVYRLAQEMEHWSLAETRQRKVNSNCSANLTNAALELGLQVLRMTLQGGQHSGGSCWPSRPELIGWLVNTAAVLGADAIMSLVYNWKRLFTPVEAVGTVAKLILADPIAMQLNLTIVERHQLTVCLHGLALHCARTDPGGCALHSLILCENDFTKFDQCYRLVMSTCMDSLSAGDLFPLARYLDQQQQLIKAYELAVAALRRTTIGPTDDTCPLVADVLWVCWLADCIDSRGVNVREPTLPDVVHLVVANVKCASVLMAILRGYGLESHKPQHKHLYSLLSEAAVEAYHQTAVARLERISPRQYGNFADFLDTVRDAHLLAINGQMRFRQFITVLKCKFPGKKKLISLIDARFFC